MMGTAWDGGSVKAWMVFGLGSALFLMSCSSLSREGATSVESVLTQSQDVADLLNEEYTAATPVASSGAGSGSDRSPASAPATDRLTPSFQQPLRLMKINSRYGRRNGQLHEGVDLKAGYGTPIYASSEGIVVYAADRIQGYGDTVIVRHIGTYSTLYAHASQLRVKPGDRVAKGQCIAYAGDSGRASGPHLHFEIRRDLKPVDPTPYLWRPPVVRGLSQQAPGSYRKNGRTPPHALPSRLTKPLAPPESEDPDEGTDTDDGDSED